MQDKLKLLPLLFLYVFIVLIAYGIDFQGDERRYIWFATNLSHGFYSPQDEINLWNGPGYPILLLPFVLLNVPWLTAKLFNALFLFLAILYFYGTLRLYMQKNSALIFSYILGIYPLFLRYMHKLLTEQFAIFLICGFIYHFCKVHKDIRNYKINLLLASIYLGYLALVKVFFGYVILTGLLFFLSSYIFKQKEIFKKTLLVYLLSLVLCIPYLFYTYSLTGKIFYWGNSGGISLYLMSTPYEDEYGDWNIRDSQKHRAYYIENAKKNLSAIELDDEYKRKAMENIINYPKKYFLNWLANIGRLLFNYPYSYDKQKLNTYFYLIPNMFIVVFIILMIYPTYLSRKSIPFEMFGLIHFGLVAFMGSTFLDAENRYFWPLVPVFFLWISFMLSNVVKIKICK
jgi:hypothetical protein